MITIIFSQLSQLCENTNKLFLEAGCCPYSPAPEPWTNNIIRPKSGSFDGYLCKDEKHKPIFYKNSELPILEELIEMIKDIRNFKPDLIFAVGGGAVIDYAKIANVVDIRDDLKNLIENYAYPFSQKYTKLAVIPTTAGSGAEVTSNAVIYVEGIKHSFES